MTRVVCLGIAVKDLVFEVDQLPREPLFAEAVVNLHLLYEV